MAVEEFLDETGVLSYRYTPDINEKIEYKVGPGGTWKDTALYDAIKAEAKAAAVAKKQAELVDALKVEVAGGDDFWKLLDDEPMTEFSIGFNFKPDAYTFGPTLSMPKIVTVTEDIPW